MSIITGRRLNYFFKKAVKPIEGKIKTIEKKIENVLSPAETDKYIFSDSKSGFVPKTIYKYNDDKEFRFLRADGEWVSPALLDAIANRAVYNIDAQNAAVTDYITPYDTYYGGILLVSIFKKSNEGSHIGKETLMASYAYSVVMSDEIIKIAALSSSLSSTYGTISAVNDTGENTPYGVKIKINKGYSASIKIIR